MDGISAVKGEVILRTTDPAGLPARIGAALPDSVRQIEIIGLAGDMTPLATWGAGVPLDLVMTDPVAELALLYRCAELLDAHPVRVSLPFEVGLARAMKLALALGFAVRLQGHQPTWLAVAEARAALVDYLHNPTVSQPVEPFHGLLVSFVHDQPVSLWSLLEQDPAEIQVIDDDGALVRDAGPASLGEFQAQLLATGGECSDCPWLSRCGGYFKWPVRDFTCAAAGSGIQRLFSDIEAAAGALRADLSAAEAPPEPG